MKIGIVWENGVSKWMSQMFEPLMDMPEMDVNIFIGERNKFDVSTVTLKKQRLSHREEILLGLSGVPSSLIRLINSPFKKMDFYYHSLNKYLKDYDIIECYDSSRSLHTLAELKKRGKGFKLIVSYLENIPYRQIFDEKTNHIKHAAYEMIDHFIPWCNTIKKAMLLEGIPEEKITTIYTSIDINLFKPEPKDEAILKELNIKKNDFIILYIGKLTSWKGVLMLPYAAKILSQKGYKDFCFLIGGRGAQIENLKKIIDEAGVERHFRFLGFMPYENIRNLYNLSDVFVCPSYPAMTWQEQFGMVLVEAMACGKPVIASTTGSIPEIIGDAGITFIPGDFFGFAEKIALLMDDRNLAEELGQKGRKRVEEYFDAKKNAKKIYEVYRKVMGNRKNS